MKKLNLMSFCLIALTILPSFIFRGCGGNPAIDRVVLQSEIIGEWYLDNSAIETAKSINSNIPEYVIKDNDKSNKIVIHKNGTCEISLTNLYSYDNPEYFEKQGNWNLTNIPYSKGSTRANNIVTLPWKTEFALSNMRMKILEEEGKLVLYHYLFRDEDIGVKVKYRRLSLNEK